MRQTFTKIKKRQETNEKDNHNSAIICSLGISRMHRIRSPSKAHPADKRRACPTGESMGLDKRALWTQRSLGARTLADRNDLKKSIVQSPKDAH